LFAAYLMQNGNVVKDGDTVGVSGNERIKTMSSNRFRHSGQPVFYAVVA